MKTHNPLKKLKRKKQHKDYLRRKRKGLLFPKSKKFQVGKIKIEKDYLKELNLEVKVNPENWAEPKKKNWLERLWEWVKKVIHS